MIKKRVSELISLDEIRRWNDGDVISIKAGTGAGKSYFIKNILYALAKVNNKKILMLIHRTNCINQFKDEIIRDKKDNIIDIRTYQSIENVILNKKGYDLSKYKYIVCDEFHYFMGDASFNKTTDISLNKILENNQAVKIFMSATGDYVKGYINGIKKIDTIDYEMPINYDFIKSLSFFNKDETIHDFINQCIENGDKAIFFIQSAKKAHELYERHKDKCIFNCSKSNENYYKYVDSNKIEKMLKEECFKENILITTTCLDAGVNIIDTELVHIVCDVEDIGTLIQCIGRKRIQNDTDKINLYIKNINNQQLGGKETQLKSKIEKADFLRINSVRDFIEKYPRSLDYTYITYDDITDSPDTCTKKINELMYYKCKCDLVDIEFMLVKSAKKPPKFGYCRYVSSEFGFKDNYRIIEEDSNKDTLKDYLESIVGEKMYKKEQKCLKEEFNKAGLRDRTMGINTMRGKLLDEKLPYLIDVPERKSYRDENGKTKKEKVYWIIKKIVG